MSLIERAIGRLNNPGNGNTPGATPGPSASPSPTAPPGAIAPAQKTSSIESFADRLEGKTPSVVSHSAHQSSGPSGTTVEPGPGGIRIHLESMRARGMVTPDGRTTRISEEFRVIKRPLLANAFGRGTQAIRHGKRVMVTSAFPGEGKSFCAINLAMSIAAERDHKVILVDADIARPSIPRELGITTDVGLMDWLLDGKPELPDLVLPTNVDRLSLLPAGRRHAQATELLASGAMTRLLDQLSARFPDRIIIFDSPPLLITTEARVLASYMGQIALVVEAGKTPRDSVAEALSTISSCEVVGVVLNKARQVDNGGYYKYGYGYGGAA
jgi:protein-tyrosine kinase